MLQKQLDWATIVTQFWTKIVTVTETIDDPAG